jgi:RNA polymerase sigma-70 factor (ECF subfamily)
MAVVPTVLDRSATDIAVKAPRQAASRGAVPSSGLAAPVATTFSDATDHELLLASRRGGQSAKKAGSKDTKADQAFAELYRRHKQEIYTYCLRMMNRDREAASDLFQEVFVRAYERAEQFRSGSNVRGWLYTIARNLCLNAHRGKRPTDSIDLFPSLESSDRSLAPEYDEEQHFLRERLETAIAELPAEFREAFVLREMDGFSYSEIAQMTGSTLPMTKVRIYRAKERLRALLKPYLAE